MSKPNPLHTPPGIVIKAEKRVPYSVINITDINAYRQERHEYEIAWEKKYVTKQAVVRAMVHGLVGEQSKDLTFNHLEQQEISYRKMRDGEFLDIPKTMRHLHNNENKPMGSSYDEVVLELAEFNKVTLGQRFSNLVAKLMKSGFGW